jgi:hypothetical protein
VVLWKEPLPDPFPEPCLATRVADCLSHVASPDPSPGGHAGIEAGIFRSQPGAPSRKRYQGESQQRSVRGGKNVIGAQGVREVGRRALGSSGRRLQIFRRHIGSSARSRAFPELEHGGSGPSQGYLRNGPLTQSGRICIKRC